MAQWFILTVFGASYKFTVITGNVAIGVNVTTSEDFLVTMHLAITNYF